MYTRAVAGQANARAVYVHVTLAAKAHVRNAHEDRVFARLHKTAYESLGTRLNLRGTCE